MAYNIQTLLDAARYIELQEQHRLSNQSEAFQFLPTARYNSTAINNHVLNNSNTSYTNRTVVQTSSPPVSPIFTNRLIQNGGSTANHRLQDYSQTTAGSYQTNSTSSATGHLTKNEEPIINGHSAAPPLVVLSQQAPSQSTHSLSPQSYDASRSRSSSLSSNPMQTGNGLHHALTEDSSQSSLNLSSTSSGYISGSSVSGGANLNTIINGTNNHVQLTCGQTQQLIGNGTATMMVNETNLLNHFPMASTNRRRTTSSNSNGAGTREVHNKLEKNRRAHLKECFEQLKVQLKMTGDKKTSNLAILGNATRNIAQLKRREREMEHEMERLAKEKILKQQRLAALKREMVSTEDLSDIVVSSGMRDRVPSESPSEQSISTGRLRYESTSSLSSTATASSPNSTVGSVHGLASVSPLIQTTIQSPQYPQSPVTMCQPIPIVHTTNGRDLLTNKMSQMVGLANGTNGIVQSLVQSQQNQIAINFTTADGPTILSTASNTIPLQLTAPSPVQIVNGTTSVGGIVTAKDLTAGKNGVRSIEQHIQSPPLMATAINPLNVISTMKDSGKSVAIDTEPPTKVIKLGNSTYALTSVDKDNKCQFLSQVVNPLPLLVSPALRVIGQGPNGIATIELTNSNVPQRNQQIVQPAAAQLHKLLSSGTTAVTCSTVPTTCTPELARLPGGAELNVLPSLGTNGTTIYRNGKLTFVNSGLLKHTTGTGKEYLSDVTSTTNGVRVTSANAIHLQAGPSAGLTGLTPIVVSQGQNGTNLAHIINATGSQLPGKVVGAPLSVTAPILPALMTGTQYLNTKAMIGKPMVVTVSGNGQTTVHNGASIGLSAASMSNGTGA